MEDEGAGDVESRRLPMSAASECRGDPPDIHGGVRSKPDGEEPLVLFPDQGHHDISLDGLQEPVQVILSTLRRGHPLAVRHKLPRQEKTVVPVALRPGEHLRQELAR